MRVGSARIDERGNIVGGAPGDQTGKEVAIENWYRHSSGWRILRAKSDTVREKIAQAVERACENDNIGYNQNRRNTLMKAAASVGYDPARVKEKCECDCSSLLRVALAYAGILVEDFYTGNEAEIILATNQFDMLTDEKYTDSPDWLKRGDILLTKVQGHTAVCLDTGAKQAAEDEKVEKYKDNAIVEILAHEVIEGKWGNGAERRTRLTEAGYDYNAVQIRVNAILQEQLIDALARQVIEGVYGNGAARREALGDMYEAVQARVNEILRG